MSVRDGNGEREGNPQKESGADITVRHRIVEREIYSSLSSLRNSTHLEREREISEDDNDRNQKQGPSTPRSLSLPATYS